MIKQASYKKANESGEEAMMASSPYRHSPYRHWAPSEQKVKLTGTVRPGSKVKYNEGKNKLTNYID